MLCTSTPRDVWTAKLLRAATAGLLDRGALDLALRRLGEACGERELVAV